MNNENNNNDNYYYLIIIIIITIIILLLLLLLLLLFKIQQVQKCVLLGTAHIDPKEVFIHQINHRTPMKALSSRNELGFING